nr:MAG TPA: hypothetical protein [Caudoviricetes sp.]
MRYKEDTKTPDQKPGQFEKFIEMIPSIPKCMLSLICGNHKHKKEL